MPSTAASTERMQPEESARGGVARVANCDWDSNRGSLGMQRRCQSSAYFLELATVPESVVS